MMYKMPKKLNKDIVAEIRHRYSTEDITQQQLAQEYGICNQNVSKILSYKTWCPKNNDIYIVECYY